MRASLPRHAAVAAVGAGELEGVEESGRPAVVGAVAASA
jgi:hypothetical protein